MRRSVLLTSMTLAVLLVSGAMLVGSKDAAQAAFSGQNGKIAFVSNRDGNREIYTMEADGSNPTRLTNYEGLDRMPAWSSDGTKIAFVRDITIHAMNSGGSGITNLRTEALEPAWSPDGTKIAFWGAGGINTVNADGSGRTQLTNYTGDFVDTDPSWQPLPQTSYDFSGFFSPVNNLPTVNKVKAGSAIPVKFSLGGDDDLDIFATGYPQSGRVPNDPTDPLDNIEQTVTANSSGLSYDDATERYTYTWKTSKDWSGQTRRLVLKLEDGTEREAEFKLTR